MPDGGNGRPADNQGAPERSAAGPAAPAFPSPGFTRFWVGDAVSAFGSYVTLLALQTLVVLTLHGTAQEVGWLNSVRWLPYLLLGLVVGALVDRRRRRPMMVTTDLTQAILLMSIPLAWATGVLTLPLLLVIVFCYGTASLINGAASMSVIPRLVPAGHLQRAHSRIDGANAVAQTSGPALAGLLVKLVGAPIAVLVDAATYLFSAAMIATIRLHEPPHLPARVPNLRREIGEGLGWIYRTSGLARLAVATHIWFAANAIVGTVLAPFVLITLGLSPLEFGIITALGGVGGFLGAATTSAGGRRLGTGGAIITAHVASTAGAGAIVVAGLGTHDWAAMAVAGAGVALHGFGIGFGNSHEMSYRQVLTPDGLQARTNTTMRSFNRAVIVAVAPLAGLLATHVGARPTLIVAAAIFGATAAMLAASPFRSVRLQPPVRITG
jgi:MFS family permease